jgi:uncharacterized protein YraI
MRVRLAAAAAFAGTVLALSGLAKAQEIAYAVPGTTNVRAGPGTNFPVLIRVTGGTRLFVFGCLEELSWCDIQVDNIRGWIYASRLEFLYAGRRVLLPRYYAYFNAPLIEFTFDYWDRYYRDRPWYYDWRWRRPRGNTEPPVVGGGPGGPEIEGPGARSPRGHSPGGQVIGPPVETELQAPPAIVGDPDSLKIERQGAPPRRKICPPDQPNC